MNAPSTEETVSTGETATARPGLVVTAVILLVASIVLTLLCFDVSGTRGPRPPWFLALPAICGLLGGGAGLGARRTALGVTTGLVGVFAVPVALVLTTLVSGP